MLNHFTKLQYAQLPKINNNHIGCQNLTSQLKLVLLSKITIGKLIKSGLFTKFK